MGYSSKTILKSGVQYQETEYFYPVFEEDKEYPQEILRDLFGQRALVIEDRCGPRIKDLQKAKKITFSSMKNPGWFRKVYVSTLDGPSYFFFHGKGIVFGNTLMIDLDSFIDRRLSVHVQNKTFIWGSILSGVKKLIWLNGMDEKEINYPLRSQLKSMILDHAIKEGSFKEERAIEYAILEL